MAIEVLCAKRRGEREEERKGTYDLIASGVTYLVLYIPVWRGEGGKGRVGGGGGMGVIGYT